MEKSFVWHAELSSCPLPAPLPSPSLPEQAQGTPNQVTYWKIVGFFKGTSDNGPSQKAECS